MRLAENGSRLIQVLPPQSQQFLSLVIFGRLNLRITAPLRHQMLIPMRADHVGVKIAVVVGALGFFFFKKIAFRIGGVRVQVVVVGGWGMAFCGRCLDFFVV
jgi:hypothetical protein